MNEITELHYDRYTAQELDPEGLKVRISHPLLLRFGLFFFFNRPLVGFPVYVSLVQHVKVVGGG